MKWNEWLVQHCSGCSFARSKGRRRISEQVCLENEYVSKLALERTVDVSTYITSWHFIENKVLRTKIEHYRFEVSVCHCSSNRLLNWCQFLSENKWLSIFLIAIRIPRERITEKQRQRNRHETLHPDYSLMCSLQLQRRCSSANHRYRKGRICRPYLQRKRRWVPQPSPVKGRTRRRRRALSVRALTLLLLAWAS